MLLQLRFRPALLLTGLLCWAVADPSPQASAQVSTQASAQASDLTPAEIADGWISLFDGETLFGWQPAGKANWQVVDRAITVSSGEITLLHTTAEFDDYILRVEFRADANTNSGLFLRTPPRPSRPGGDCIELNIAPPDNPFPTGSLVQQQRSAEPLAPADWHSFEVTLLGDQITVKLDGKLVNQYRGAGPRGRGHIGLQHNQGAVAFRNLRLKPLRLSSLWNGKNLDGWKSYPEMASRFSVTEAGELHVQNGKGQLESLQQFGDFILQAACMVNGEQLNSGIFFRCIPGEVMNGYESQIHNGFVDGDRHRPQDCGTGGIFRRQDARRVVSNDREWFYKTLVVTGPHVSVWVNGFQVTDWTDRRKPDPNPRKGLRTAPGTIMIQGHDPTTDFLFKGMAARELAE